MLEPFFNKVAGLKACNFIKKKLQHKCFPVNIAKYLRAPTIVEKIKVVRMVNVSLLHFLKFQ